MYLITVGLVCLYLYISNCLDVPDNAGNKNGNISLAEFGELYGQMFKRGLGNFGKVTLADQAVSFEKKDGWAGKLTLTRGFMGVDLNINFIKKEVETEEIHPLPEGSQSAHRMFYKYVIPEIKIQYNVLLEVKYFGTFTGSCSLPLKNQIVRAKLESIQYNDGSCIYGDKGLDVKFNVDDYKAEFILDGSYIKDPNDSLSQDILLQINPLTTQGQNNERLRSSRIQDYLYSILKAPFPNINCHVIYR